MQVDSAGRDLDLRVWAHQRVVQRRRARRLALIARSAAPNRKYNTLSAATPSVNSAWSSV